MFFWRILKNSVCVFTITSTLFPQGTFILARTHPSKVNMKSPICHDFPSPDLLEGPEDGKIKENAKFFSF